MRIKARSFLFDRIHSKDIPNAPLRHFALWPRAVRPFHRMLSRDWNAAPPEQISNKTMEKRVVWPSVHHEFGKCFFSKGNENDG